MFDVLEMIYLRLAKLFANKGFVDASGEASVPEDFDSTDESSVPMPFRPGPHTCINKTLTKRQR
jgi:hypothetical protein